MSTLHKHSYVLSEAVSSLVPSTGPVLCRDEMEEWSASEANLFEEALEKYGKDFTDIRQDFVRLGLSSLTCMLELIMLFLDLPNHPFWLNNIRFHVGMGALMCLILLSLL